MNVIIVKNIPNLVINFILIILDAYKITKFLFEDEYIIFLLSVSKKRSFSK